jgi:hypothetical protein
MKHPDPHLSDQQLLLYLDGELSSREGKTARSHLSACWACRVRRQELEGAIADFIGVHNRRFESELPPPAGPRALLKARLAEVSATSPARFPQIRFLTAAVATVAVLALGIAVSRLTLNHGNSAKQEARSYYMPDARLTPGATVILDRSVVCSEPGEGNRPVPVALQRQVFQEYGIPKADPRAYEVDYLVTPALGGADDIHNLWPHSHSATWNAHVKDALEDRLREMVCDGSLDLSEAQQAIATDWISAYKKYFHTAEPLAEHRK